MVFYQSLSLEQEFFFWGEEVEIIQVVHDHCRKIENTYDKNNITLAFVLLAFPHENIYK
jgi:DNA anti-recombination protein RmuC